MIAQAIAVILVATLGARFCLTAAVSYPQVVSVVPTSKPESVYDWESEHCADGRPLDHAKHPTPYQRDVPDAPAMAWRDPRTNITYMAPGDSRGTWANVGVAGLTSVKHDCSKMIFNYSGVSGWRKRPSAFSNHEWLYAPFVVPPEHPGDNTTVYMLVHNEFHGWELEEDGLCNASENVHRRCWYGSATLSVSYDGGASFEHARVPPAHLVGASRTVYVANKSAYGVSSPSQIVTSPRDGFHYSFPHFESFDGETRGVCSMRTKDVSDPSSWRFWTGSQNYSGQFKNPYESTDGADCAILNVSVSQAVPKYLPFLDVFIMVGYSNFGSKTHFGISTAPEPWGPWSELKPIFADIDPAGEGTRGIYPSLLDPASVSLNFDTLESEDVYVYWVQARNKAAVHAPDMARDLLRQRVRLNIERPATSTVVEV